MNMDGPMDGPWRCVVRQHERFCLSDIIWSEPNEVWIAHQACGYLNPRGQVVPWDEQFNGFAPGIGFY